MTSAFYVYGDPVPQGSMKCIGKRGKVLHQLVPDHARELEDWRDRIVTACTRDYPGSGRVIRFAQYVPVCLEITYSLARPASHYGTGRNTGQVKSSAPAYPTRKGTGDVDKLERAVLDALTEAKVLHDDAQVVEVTHRKRYAEPVSKVRDVLDRPGVLIRIYPEEDR